MINFLCKLPTKRSTVTHSITVNGHNSQTGAISIPKRINPKRPSLRRPVLNSWCCRPIVHWCFDTSAKTVVDTVAVPYPMASHDGVLRMWAYHIDMIRWKSCALLGSWRWCSAVLCLGTCRVAAATGAEPSFGAVVVQTPQHWPSQGKVIMILLPLS